MIQVISVLIENHFGAFDRVATMFSGKGFNLKSITIGETEIANVSRMTIVTEGEGKDIDKVVKQLNRLVDTIKVIDLSNTNHVERELALIKIDLQNTSLDEMKNVCDIFRGNVVDINNKSIMLEITGPPEKIDAVVNVLMPFGIIEMARSGNVALRRGEQLKIKKKEYPSN